MFFLEVVSCQICATRIFGAFGPIMFNLWVWVGFRASWRGEPLFLNSSFMFGRTHISCLEGHISHVWKDTWQHFGSTLFELLLLIRLFFAFFVINETIFTRAYDLLL